MRVFEKYNQYGTEVCPVCQTNREMPVVLIPIPGTEDDGLIEAKQVHKECYDNIKAIVSNIYVEAQS